MQNGGIKSDKAADSDTAMRMLKQKVSKTGSAYQMIFIDCNMSSCNGGQVARQIRDFISYTAASPVYLIGMV